MTFISSSREILVLMYVMKTSDCCINRCLRESSEPPPLTRLQWVREAKRVHNTVKFNEMVLVLCAPECPDWALFAFDLDSSDIASSRWVVDYSALLVGASVLSFSFCPLHERRLYVLDSFGYMRAIEISRRSASSGTSITTVETAEIPSILTAISKKSGSLLTATLRE